MFGYSFPCGDCSGLQKDRYGMCCSGGMHDREFMNKFASRINNGEPDTECSRYSAIKRPTEADDA